MGQRYQRIPCLNVPGTWYLSRMLSCVGVRRVMLLRAMCWLVPVISRGCYRSWVYDVLCCCARCADWYRYRVKGMARVRAVVTIHTHGPKYQSAKYEYGRSPPNDALLVAYLVPGISRGCYPVWVYDVLYCCVWCADWYQYRLKGMPKTRKILVHSPNYQSARYEYGSIPPKDTLVDCTWHLLSLVDAIVCGCTTSCVAACDVLTHTGTAWKECQRCVL